MRDTDVERGRLLRGRPLVPIALVTGLAAVPLLFREAILYKFGVVLIFFVAAIGLHILVNWAGQLSLAHAATVGLPAFSVLTLSEAHQISPIYLLPVAVAIGVTTGGLVALPTLRARGLQVAVVTLVAGIAIDRFFFTQEWLVGGSSGRAAADPTLGSLHFTSYRSLYPVLMVIVGAAVVAAWMLMHSKLARGWFWVRADPTAASGFGIPVVTYRIAAYAVGGAFGGLAGGLTAMWVQRLGSSAFPTTLSFSYLLVVVLAGGGFVGGVVAATLVLEGGRQFASNVFGVDAGNVVDTLITYGGPIGLIDLLGREQTGLNGLGGKVMAHIRSAIDSRAEPAGGLPRLLRAAWASIAGSIAIGAGFIAMGLAWRHVSQTDQVLVQNQELLSGGIGGLSLIVLGVGLLICDQLHRGRRALAQELEALVDRLAASDNAASAGGEATTGAGAPQLPTGGDGSMHPEGVPAAMPPDKEPRRRPSSVVK